jgi:hypothetical protein
VVPPLRFPHKSETLSNFSESKWIMKNVKGASGSDLRPTIRLRESATDDQQRVGRGLQHRLQRSTPVLIQILRVKKNGNNFVLAEARQIAETSRVFQRPAVFPSKAFERLPFHWYIGTRRMAAPQTRMCHS